MILRLATATPAESTFGYGHVLYETSVPTLLSVIAVNRGTDLANLYIYVVGSGDEEVPESWGVVAYNLPLSPGDSYETFRFAMNSLDTLYVAGSANVSYFAQGASQS